jgi:hypothetical protein
VQECTGSPKTCTPLWSASIPGDFGLGRLTATDDVVYKHVQDCSGGCGNGVSPLGAVWGFDAHGVENCGGTPKTCGPIWIGNSNNEIDFGDAAPTVASGKVYLDISGPFAEVSIFDASGVTNCTGTLPKMCTEIASIAPAALDAWETPVVGGRLFVNAAAGSSSDPLSLSAFNANGGSTPLWTSNVAVNRGPAAVADGRVFVVRNDANRLLLLAFDAAGVHGCSGVPKTCTPLWTGLAGGSVGYTTQADILVAGGVVIVSMSDRVLLFDASGHQGCSGTPALCNPLNHLAGGETIAGHPIVVWNRVFVPAQTELFALRTP